VTPLQDVPSLRDVADKVDDVARALARQSAVLAALSDAPAAGPDLPLLVDLHALRGDALACAATARSRRERAGFDALAAGLERLLTGRGGTVVAPAAGEAFDGRTMEAAEVVATHDPAADRTVAALLDAGLAVDGRCVRPARVAVRRAR
jgi:molecular chaperone GrpE